MPKTLYVDIVAPDSSVFRGEVEGIRAPGVEGSFEVLYDHAPMIAVFGVGPLRIRMPGGEELNFATSGGFLEVLNNTVTVLAETAEPASDIDVDRARQSEQRALEQLEAAEDPEARERAEEALQRSRNRLRVSMGSV